MNNKGVTLIELLIVIVVLGIISAFAIPAVGTIIAIENAAKLYCASNSCLANQTLVYDDIAVYVQSFDAAYYADCVLGDTDPIATKVSGDWQVTLEKAGTGDTNVDDEWEWVTTVVPSAGSRDNVVDDDN